MSWLNEMDAKRDEIRALCPGWRVWYVPNSQDGSVTWCAQREPTLNAASPEHLVEYIREADAELAAQLHGTARQTILPTPRSPR